MPQKPDIRRQDERETATGKPRPARVTAAWPDQRARAEMSDAEVTRQSLGKHGKNQDWEPAW